MISILRRISPWIASCSMLLFLLSWSFMPARYYLQMHQYLDDSFFYYTVARNIVSGLGSTFDGINQTNGYQPLWQLICVVLASFKTSQQTFLHLINVLQSVCAATVVFFVARHWVCRCALSPFTLLPLGFAFLYSQFFSQFTNGLETALNMALLSMIGSLLCRRDEARPCSALALGALCGLAFLARTDTVFLSILVSALIFLHQAEGQKGRLRRSLEFAAPFLIFVLPYLAINIFIFDTFLPISGMVKKTWAQLTVAAEAPLGISLVVRKMQLLAWPLDHADYYPIALLVCINLICLVLSALLRRWGTFIFASFSVVKYVAYVLFFHTYARFQWYYAPDYVVALFVVPSTLSALLGGRITARNRELVTGIASLVLFSALLASGWATNSPYSALVNLRHHQNLYAAKVPPSNELQLYHAAAYFIDKMPLPPRAVLSAHNSGVLGFFSRRRVVNMDGLINGLTRLSYIKRDGWDFLPYLDSQEYIGGYVDCVADPAYPDYRRSFVTERGYVEINLKKLVVERFGYAPTNSLVLFLKPQMIEGLRNDKKFARYILTGGELRG